MLSFLSQRNNSDSDHDDSDDDHNNEDDKKVQGDSGANRYFKKSARSASPSTPLRFAAMSTDTIDYADAPTPRTIANDLRPGTDEEKGMLTGNGEKNGKPRNGVVVRTPKPLSDKQKAENIYSANKSIAEGMMDIALLTSNANQLKFLLSYNTKSKSFYINVTLIAISLMLQVAVGVSLIVKKNLRPKRNSRAAHFVNQFVVIGIFLVTVINIFVAAFTTADT